MKRLTLLLAFLFCAIGYSQAEHFETEYVDLLKKDLKTEVRKLVEDNLDLTDEQAKVFWPIYDEYEAELLELSNERVNAIADYMLDYYDLSDEKAEQLINKVIEIDQKRLDLQKKYIDKMNDVLPAKLVGKFFQIDNFLQTLITIQRQSTIPLVKTESEE